ncbi:MAG: preprotein translocase subunit SecE [Acidobacteriaceae bacterium]
MSKAAVVETTEQSALQRLAAGPQRLMQFIRETRQEMTKVHVPSRVEVQSTTIVVIIAVFLFAAYFEAVDLTIGKGVDQLILYLTKHY